MNLVIDDFRPPPFRIFDHETRTPLEGEYATWEEAKEEMVRLRGFRHNLQVEGLEYDDEEDAPFTYDGTFPPFAIFDIDAQENLQPYYLTRGQAEMAMARILEGEPR